MESMETALLKGRPHLSPSWALASWVSRSVCFSHQAVDTSQGLDQFD